LNIVDKTIVKAQEEGFLLQEEHIAVIRDVLCFYEKYKFLPRLSRVCSIVKKTPAQLWEMFAGDPLGKIVKWSEIDTGVLARDCGRRKRNG